MLEGSPYSTVRATAPIEEAQTRDSSGSLECPMRSGVPAGWRAERTMSSLVRRPLARHCRASHGDVRGRCRECVGIAHE